MRSLLFAAAFLFSSILVRAQSNYEIQVYASDLVPPGVTMTELHSNFTVDGFKTRIDGVLPDNHAEHETLEITHGFDQWFETGFYVFTSIQNGTWYYAGSHLRPRIAVPEKYHLPVGLSLSTEFGWVRPNLSADTWTWEIRPIVDKKIEKWYLCFNPAIEKSFRGPEQPRGYEFSPNFKFSYDVTRRVAAGIEYYGALGPITGFDAVRDQQHQIFPNVDVDFGKNWEFNFGVGAGVTQATERLLVKAILGYRFNYKGQ
ncbi:MAG: transporter [Bryobacteraceae bacterium]